MYKRLQTKIKNTRRKEKIITTVQPIAETNVKPQSQKSQLGPEKRIEVFENMTVSDVQQNGSEAQRILAKAFDTNKDEKYSEREARWFNHYRFALDKDKKELRVYNTKNDCKLTIKYNNLTELESRALYCYAGCFKTGNIVLDLRNRTALFQDVSRLPHRMSIADNKFFNRVTIRNASFKDIYATNYTGELILENVKDMGMLWDSATNIYISDETDINADSDSSIKIRRQ